jgi:hypothetical protein
MLYVYLKTSNYCNYDIALKWKEHVLDFLRRVVVWGDVACRDCKNIKIILILWRFQFKIVNDMKMRRRRDVNICVHLRLSAVLDSRSNYFG